MPCATIPTGATFASGLVRYTDCQARTIGEAGYRALAMPGAMVPMLLGVLLTIMIALIGYRLILGETPTARDGVLVFVKIGVVLAFATGWSAYRPVVYDVALTAPAEIAARIGGASGLPEGEGFAAHLDAVDGQFQQLAIETVDHPATVSQTGPVAPPLFANFDVFALGSARILFLAGALASYAAPKLLAGLLLALGPLFIASLLFDATRGLAEAWISVLAGAALATIAAAIVLGVELALLEPWLADLIVRRVGSEATPGLPSELLVTTLVFNVILLAVCVGMAVTAARLRFALGRSAASVDSRAAPAHAVNEERGSIDVARFAAADRSRAAAIAEAAATLHRRETGPASATISVQAAGTQARPTAPRIDPEAASRFLSASRRRTVPRRSNSAGQRDRRS